MVGLNDLRGLFQPMTDFMVARASLCKASSAGVEAPAIWPHIPQARGCSWGALNVQTSAGHFSGVKSCPSSCRLLS